MAANHAMPIPSARPRLRLNSPHPNRKASAIENVPPCMCRSAANPEPEPELPELEELECPHEPLHDLLVHATHIESRHDQRVEPQSDEEHARIDLQRRPRNISPHDEHA